MGIHNLDKIFHPKSIAVIGASGREKSIGSILMHNLIKGGYSEKIYPVNYKSRVICNLPVFPSVLNIKAPVDLAVIATPIATVPQIIKECVEAGVGGIVIISAGGKETGEKGKELESEIKKAAEGSGIRIIGPNCLGVISCVSNMNASFASHMPLKGKMALVSQSGAICTTILDLSIREKMGFSYFISVGSMLDADFADLIDYLGNDYRVSSIVLYIENLTRFRSFMSAARAVSRIKPIIVYKAGKTKIGAKAAASHTGALAGEDAVYDTAFKRAGIIRVKTFEELFDCAELLAKQSQPADFGLAIVTNAGALGVMAVDALDGYGMTPVQLSAETVEKLDKVLPSHWSHGNPIDILGDASPKRFSDVVRICINAPEINIILLLTVPQGVTNPSDIARSVAGFLKEKSFPLFVSWIGGQVMEEGRKILNNAGIVTFDTAERAVRAFMDFYHYSKNIVMLQEVPPKFPGGELKFDREKAEAIIKQGLARKNKLLTEIEAKELVSAYGIAVNLTQIAGSEDEAVYESKKTGFPVAMKIFSRDITHKSDAGGVKLNLTDEKDVRNAFKKVMEDAKAYNSNAKIEGVTIQSMLRRPDYELIMGAKKDRDFGPVILFGMGGIMTEILKDRSLGLPPLNRLLARRMIEDTKVYRILQGYRNHPPANILLIEEMLIRLAQLVTDFAEIEEIDINPVLVVGDEVCAVDARVLLKASDVISPLHLVVSPYPNEHEIHIKVKGGIEVFIRPIRPEDAPLFTDLFNSLSSRSVYRRFFSHIKRLSHSMLARFTQIDYDRHIALIAMDESSDSDEMVGVARIILEVIEKKADFSVLVRDSWQGKGIGTELLERCLKIARAQGNIKKVQGIVLPENTGMLKLGRKLGFEIKRDSEDPTHYALTLEF